MTDTTPAVFDPKALQERIAKSVQATFGMLIPEAQFQGMVEKEVKAFLETETKFLIEEEQRKSTSGSWNNDTYKVVYANMTPFRKQVWDEMNRLVHQHLDGKLGEDFFKAEIVREWNNNGMGNTGEAILSDMLRAHLEKLAPKMAASMFQQVFAEAVSQSKREIMAEVSNKLGH